METHGCASSAADAVAVGVRAGRGASRPDAVMRATSVPSAVSAMVCWPSTQSGPWNSASTAGHRRGLRPLADTARLAVGLPPTAPIRDEAQRPVPAPRRAGRPTRPAPPATCCAGPAACSVLVPVQRRRRRGRAAGPRRSRRPTACPGGPRRPRRGGRRSDAAAACRRSRAPRAAWSRTATPRRVDRATTLRTGRADPSRWISRTARTHSPSAVALSPPCRCTSPAGGGALERHRRCRARPAWRRAVTEPHPLVRLVHVGEGTGGPSGHEAQGAPAVLVDPAADAHALRRVVGHARGIGPHDHRPARLGRAGLEPVDRVAVRAQLRERDLGPGHVPRRERRGPTPITCESWSRSERTRCNGKAGRRRHRPLQ